MEPKDVLAELTLTQELLGGTSPAGATVTVKVAPEGFYHSGGLGGTGQSTDPLPAEHVARMLTESFDAAALRAIFDRLVALRAAL
jgi:hypothetical protein